MEKKCGGFARWSLDGHENAVELREEEDDEALSHLSKKKEALSLSDLPLIHQSRTEKIEPAEIIDDSDAVSDFDFGAILKESQMCTADEVFFKGQILPLRHSVSSDGRRSLNRSRYQSIDNPYSGSLISRRSDSSSSSSSGNAAGAMLTKPPRIRNQFHSHPSPSPRIRFPRNANLYRNPNLPKSSLWNIFRLGLLGPPEIAFQGLRTPSSESRKFGSRNSTSSNGSSAGSCNSGKKKKSRVLSAGFLPGCRYCSVDAVDTVAPNPRVVIIRRSASESEVDALNQRGGEMRSPANAKKQLSDRRTFEWLKQLP